MLMYHYKFSSFEEFNPKIGVTCVLIWSANCAGEFFD